MKWIGLDNIAQLEEINAASFQNKVVIFKHSTRCGISRMVLKNFENEVQDKAEFKNISFYYLDLIQYRKISNAIADKWQIEHQSPQIIVISNGMAIHDASHYSIKTANI